MCKRAKEAAAKKWDAVGQREFNMRLSQVRIAKRIKLWLVDNKCHYCKRPTFLDTNAETGPRLPKNQRGTLDHIITQVEGGTDSLRNMVIACTKCNSDRGCMSYERYMVLCMDPDERDRHNREIRAEREMRQFKHNAGSAIRRAKWISQYSLPF